MTSNNNFNDIQSRMEEITRRVKKQSYYLILFWFMVASLLTIVYYSLLDFHETPFRNLIYALLFALTTVNWFINIPFVGIMMIIVYRTKSKNFFYSRKELQIFYSLFPWGVPLRMLFHSKADAKLNTLRRSCKHLEFYFQTLNPHPSFFLWQRRHGQGKNSSEHCLIMKSR